MKIVNIFKIIFSIVILSITITSCIVTKIYPSANTKDNSDGGLLKAIDPTELPVGGTWAAVRAIIDDNFDNINGTLDSIEVTLSEYGDSITNYSSSKLNVSDTTSMLEPYALTSELSEAGTSIGDVRDEIADSLNLLRPLYVAVADTASMLDPYALLTDLSEGGISLSAVQDEIADSLNVLRPIVVMLIDSTGTAPGSYVSGYTFQTGMSNKVHVSDSTGNSPGNYVTHKALIDSLAAFEGGGGVTLETVQSEISDSLDARIGAGIELSDVAVIIADSTGNAPGNYVTHKALVDSINANLGGAVGITLNSGTITLTGDGGTADDITFYTNGDGSYNLPTGGGNLTIMSEVQGWINDSLDVFRPLYLEVADTASMLSNYAKLSDLSEGGVSLVAVQDEIADSLNAIRSASIAGIALSDSTGYAPGNYVTHTQLDAVSSAADSSLFVTVTRLTDSLNVMRELINDLIAVVENLGVDLSAPTIDSLELGRFADDTLMIYLSEKMNTDSIPAASVFYLTEDGSEMGVASIGYQNDSTLYAILDSAGVYGSTYLLDYTRDYPYLQDSTGNALASFTDKSITNNFEEPAASGLLSGLTAYWDMQESSGAIVDEVASLTSTGTVGTTAIEYSMAGILSNSLEFNYLPTYGGGQRIIVGDDLLLHGTTSISLWFYLTSTDQDAFCMVHNNNGGTQNRGYYFFTGGVGGGVAARAYNSSGSYVEVDSDPGWTVPSANTWYHAVFVADGTNLTIYVNGVQRAQESFAYSIDYGSDAVLIIGGRDAANGWTMNGRLDEIGVWNRALTTDEITALYNSGSGLPYSSFGN